MAERQRRGHTGTPIAEWITATIGTILFAAVVLIIVRHALAGPDAPPDIRVEVGAITGGPGNYQVSFVARNLTGTTAATVQIHGELRAGDRLVESADAQLGAVPAHSRARGGLFFTHDPRAATLAIRATGYERP
jgi:uncharacterized protein (TIGR02588 family)